MPHYVLLVVKHNLCATVISETTPAPAEFGYSNRIAERRESVLNCAGQVFFDKFKRIITGLAITGGLTLICLHGIKNEGQSLTCPLESTVVLSGLYLCFCCCLCLSFNVLFVCLPLFLRLDRVDDLIQSDPEPVRMEEARAEYINCFLAGIRKLLCSPFKLHFHVRLPYRAGR